MGAEVTAREIGRVTVAEAVELTALVAANQSSVTKLRGRTVEPRVLPPES